MAQWNDHSMSCICIKCSDQGKPAGWDAMNELFARIKHVHNQIPRGITEILTMISDPNVIQWTEEWINAVSDESGILDLLYENQDCGTDNEFDEEDNDAN